MNVEAHSEKTTMLKEFPKSSKKGNLYLVLASVVIALLGIVSGWFLSGGSFAKEKSANQEKSGVEVSKTEVGIEDESMLPDSVEGTLVEGGTQGEGTYHLERPGGPSQNVYLTSTVIDLHGFVDKKVKVWGESLSAIHAGWLMDVGKIKVLDQ